MRSLQSWHPILTKVIAIGISFLVAAIVIWFARRVMQRAISALEFINGEDRQLVLARARQIVAALTVTVYSIALLISLALVLPWLGFQVTPFQPWDIVNWLFTSGIRVVAICLVAFLVIRAAHLLIEHFKVKASRDAGGLADAERLRRATTVSGLVSRSVTVVVSTMATLVILRELSIDIMPLLTGAGIVGLAIGFGAQSLVRDIISGVFLILDDQVRVGDVARIGAVEGLVEEINLRTLVIRDVEGIVHVFPNGSIQTLANLTKNYSYAVVDVWVPATADVDTVIEVLRGIGAEIRVEPAMAPSILEPLEVFGIESLADGKVKLRSRIKTVPLKQWEIARELRRRFRNTLQSRGIAVG